MASTRIKTSFCTIGFQKNKWGQDRAIERPLTQILPLLADAGFDGVEIWADHWTLASPQEQEQVLAQLRQRGLAVAMLSSYYNFTTSEQTAAESLANAHRMLAEARRLGSRGLRLFTGKTASKDATEEQWSRCTRCLQELCDAAAADGILGCLETHSWNLMDSVEGALKLIERVARPNLKLIFQPSTFKETYKQAMGPLSPHIAHVHANNSRGGQGTALADGDIDYPWVVEQLVRMDFDGYISIEWFGGDAQAMAAREGPYLARLLGR